MQATFDEGLLDRLDRYCAARASRRSEAIREAVADYLGRKEAEEIALRHQNGYADGDPDMEGGADAGVWPSRPPDGKRRFGALRGRISVDDSFFDPLPEAELADYEGSRG